MNERTSDPKLEVMTCYCRGRVGKKGETPPYLLSIIFLNSTLIR